jgi:hypothetical protein
MIKGVDAIKLNLDKLDDLIKDKCGKALEYTIDYAENEAKKNAPWEDRTGNARNSILGIVWPEENNSLIASLSIGMFYGLYLELSYQGKYKIVWPTILNARPMVLRLLRGIL